MEGRIRRRRYLRGNAVVLCLLLGACSKSNPQEHVDAGVDAASSVDAQIVASQIVLTSGDGQAATVGTALADPFVVTVLDVGGKPVSGVDVLFVVTAGGGNVSTAGVATDAQGEAQSTLTLGTVIGTNTVEVSAAGLSGSPIVFTANGTAGQASQIVLTSGDGQAATVGTVLADPFVVTVLDVDGNPVSGVDVLFVVTAGGGSVSTASVATDMQGEAQSTSTLGTVVGTNTVEVSDAGLSGSPIVFTANGTAGAASQIVLTSGDGQAGTVGTMLADPFVVTVLDVDGNPVSGFDVSFVVTTGGGSVSTANVATDVQGEAQSTLTLGTVVGTNTVEVSAAGLSGSPIDFTANATGPDEFTTGAGPQSFAVGDINGDGKPDLVVVVGGATVDGVAVGAGVSVLLNTTAMGATIPSFASKVDFTTGTGPFDVAIGDFNGDGKPDLAITNESSDTVSILLNTTATGAPTPSFAANVDLPTGSFPQFVAVGDFNGDGRPDLAVADASGAANTVSILLNLTAPGATTPSFASKVDFPTGSGPFSVAVADFNVDGKLDVAVTNLIDNTVSVLLNTTATGATTASFAAKVDFTTVTEPFVVAVGDINGDGKPDLAVANIGNVGGIPVNTVSVFLNTTVTGAATPSFAAKVDFATGSQPVTVAVGDINGDGKPDIAVTDENSNTVSVLLNTTATDATTPTFAAKLDFTTGMSPFGVSIVDVNGDGVPDLAVTNNGDDTVSILLR